MPMTRRRDADEVDVETAQRQALGEDVHDALRTAELLDAVDRKSTRLNSSHT